MRAIIVVLLLSLGSSAHCTAATPSTKVAPRFKARVVSFNGKIDSGSSCSTTTFQPDGVLHSKGQMNCGYPGKVSDIEWAFVERRGDKDVYRFTRRFAADTKDSATSSRNIEFSDKRVVVFQDAFQVVIMERPKQ